MRSPDDGRIVGAEETGQKRRLDGPEVDVHPKVGVGVEVEQRRLLAEDAAVDTVTHHHGHTRCSVVGAVRTVLFDASAELGIHQHRCVRPSCWGERGEQQIQRDVQV